MSKSADLHLDIQRGLSKKQLDARRVSTKWKNDEEFKIVSNIVESVKRNGNASLFEFTEKFDEFLLDEKSLRISTDEIKRSYEYVNKDEIEAIKEIKNRLEIVSRKLLERLYIEIDLDGISISQRYTALESVGCYVPGGRAVYPSSLIMSVTPGKCAGVGRIVVCTPPSEQGFVNPITLVAADICEVDEIYRIGGAQAIATLAYGTESIEPVAKIVGPGNKYVTAAKRIVSQDVPIDMPAGPSELLILADETADAKLVCFDLISQAEHDPDSKVFLITDSQQLAESVRQNLIEAVKDVSKREIIKASLEKHAILCVVDAIERGVELANAIAPEHLQLVTDDDEKYVRDLQTSGIILVSDNTPVAASDYNLGTNHILPTDGYARVYSGLSVYDFVRRFHTVTCTDRGLRTVSETARLLAIKEGLPNHARAIEGRFKK